MQVVRAVDPEDDIWHLIGKWCQTDDLQERIDLERQIELLSDAVVLYKVNRLPRRVIV